MQEHVRYAGRGRSLCSFSLAPPSVVGGLDDGGPLLDIGPGHPRLDMAFVEVEKETLTQLLDRR